MRYTKQNLVQPVKENQGGPQCLKTAPGRAGERAGTYKQKAMEHQSHGGEEQIKPDGLPQCRTDGKPQKAAGPVQDRCTAQRDQSQVDEQKNYAAQLFQIG